VALCYLKRDNYHSELSFVGYNLDHPHTHPFIDDYVARYAEDLFLGDPAWDDCNQFDRLVSRLSPSVKHIAHTSQGQPFDFSILGSFMTHLKGKRK
jgi:hypothetical protein